MKHGQAQRCVLMTFLFLLCSLPIVAQDYLPDSVAIQIVSEFRRVQGMPPGDQDVAASTACADGECDAKCGMSAVMNFQASVSRIHPRLLGGLSVADARRPDLARAYLSPAGYFTIHYAVTGVDAVYEANIDSDSDGVPDFVESVAQIADSVYIFEVLTLGYPKPPVDTAAIEGGDASYDLYLKDLNGSVFGSTAADAESISGPFDQVATSYITLENDYAELQRYSSRPLDAIRVTIAHEYFHAIQFGIDIGEYDFTSGQQRRYWMEMSAVWMEEQAYDDINDYYAYLPYFFSSPRRSLQEFLFASGTVALRPYAAAIFSIYLGERFGQQVIRRIWERCALNGPNVLSAISSEVFASSGTDSLSLADALAEFGVWNYFTGLYGDAAPTGIGYEERELYPAIPDDQILRVRTVPFLTLPTDTLLRPQQNATTYLKIEELQNLQSRTLRPNRTTICIDTSLSGQCLDSLTLLFQLTGNSYCTAVNDSGDCIDTLLIVDDTTVSCFNGNGGISCSGDRKVEDLGLTRVIQLGGLFGQISDSHVVWGISTIYQREDDLFSHEVEHFRVPNFASVLFEFANPEQYRSITMVIAPATLNARAYTQQLPPGSILRFALGTTFDTIGTNLSLISRPAAVLYPYPNPAVISEMNGANMTFRFEGPTDETSFPEYGSAFLSVDIYTASGDYVATSTGSTPAEDRLGIYRTAEYQTTWNMTNQSGEPVAGGVYLAVAKLYVDASRTTLITEAKQKLLIVR